MPTTLEKAHRLLDGSVDQPVCHVIENESTGKTYCGEGDDDALCEGVWTGERHCTSCGLLVCPKCSLLSNIEDDLAEL